MLRITAKATEKRRLLLVQPASVVIRSLSSRTLAMSVSVAVQQSVSAQLAETLEIFRVD